MKIENSFVVDAPIEQAWNLLTDIPEIAPCLPGAKLTDETDGVYSGGVKVKVGPVTAEYKGSAEFVEKDEEARRAVITGKGRDTRGAGNAQALITAQMEAVGEQTRVDIVTDLKVSGKVAQFGRGVMQDVSEKLLGQFAECLENKIGEPEQIDAIAEASAADAAAESGSDADSSSADDGEQAPTAGPSETGEEPTAAAATHDIAAMADDDDDDALDLLDVAGDAMLKRFLPVIALLVVALIVLVILIVNA